MFAMKFERVVATTSGEEEFVVCKAFECRERYCAAKDIPYYLLGRTRAMERLRDVLIPQTDSISYHPQVGKKRHYLFMYIFCNLSTSHTGTSNQYRPGNPRDFFQLCSLLLVHRHSSIVIIR